MELMHIIKAFKHFITAWYDSIFDAAYLDNCEL